MHARARRRLVSRSGAQRPGRRARRALARPLTLPAGVTQVGADLGTNNDFSALAARLVAGHGITDELELTGYYGFALKELELEGDLDINVGYAALRGAAGGGLEVVPRAQAGYSAQLDTTS